MGSGDVDCGRGRDYRTRVPRLSVLSVVIVLAWACGEPDGGDRPAPPPPRTTPPSLVLLSLDTTRADRVGSYGAERDTTPRLDALAEHALLFEQARTPVGNTLLAHASLLTGLSPAAHGATPLDDGARLPDAARTLAEDLRDAGWQTAAFTTHVTWLTRKFGIDQGFEHFDVSRDAAPEVFARARAWLDARDPERPYFLFVHLFDVHSDRNTGRPYRAPEGSAGLFTDKTPGVARDWEQERVKGTLFLEAVGLGRFELRPGERDELLAQYDEGLHGLDAAVGDFLDELRAEQPRDTFTVVLSDHGEQFQEHGGMLHNELYDEVLHVPLMILPPPEEARAWGVPRRLAEPVSLMDLRPTLLSLAGLDAGGSAQGRDLLPWLERRADAPRAVPMPLGAGEHGLLLGDLKLLRTGEGPWELYDLAADPGEQRDLAGEPGMQERIAQLVAQLEQLTAADAEIERRLRGADDGGVQLSEEDLRFLDEMGYLER